jgi:hypothetical protein
VNDHNPDEHGNHEPTQARLPSIAGGEKGEVVVSLQPEGLLVGGDSDAIQAYLEQIREAVGRPVRIAGVDKATLGNATGLLSGALSVLGQSGKFVQLHPDSVKAIQKGNLIPGTDGFFRMVTRGADNKFLKQLQWKPTAVNSAGMMSVQMVAAQLALKVAIANIEDSVRRVEGKVEELLRIAHADRAGNVLSDNRSITRMVAYLEKHGSLPDADWNAIASLGPALNRMVEQLRQHALRTLKSFDADVTLRERAGLVNRAVAENRLGETLSLLVVAEESLMKWQRLRLARVEATEPDHLQNVVEDARELIMLQMAEDGELYGRARAVVDELTKTETTDGFWFWAIDGLNRDVPVLRNDLDRFAKARRAQASEWENFYAPTLLDAASHAVSIATAGAGRALAAAGDGIASIGSFFSRKGGAQRPPTVAVERSGDASTDDEESILPDPEGS